jgi:muramidase (phage lysozyme)
MTSISSNKRVPTKFPHPGPYIAEITNHLDTSYMGGLEVSIVEGLPSDFKHQENCYPVKYLSPFYGVTSVRFEGNDSSNFNDVQKSYGMWMVPPDIGTQVMVIFIDGDSNQGYWIGCVQDSFQNHMIPGLAASRNSLMTSDQQRKYGTAAVPVAEIHKKSNNLKYGTSVDKIRKAVHPFADRLLQQGLLLDEIRGTTTSGARREFPSMVFGISTPGPLDTSPGAKKGKIGYEGGRVSPISRLGGTTFVMDDGDIDGNNELVRIRTRTGHQILLHNTKDLIYIGNSKGTAWVEMTGNGKIDIYAADSVSIHSEQDLNFRADRNINIEAGGDVNVVSNQNVQIESGANFNLLSEKDFSIQSSNRLLISSEADFDIKSEYLLKIEAKDNFDIKGNSVLKIGSTGNLHISSSEDTLQNSKNFHIRSSEDGYITTGGQIHINGAPADTADEPSAASINDIDNLERFVLPNRSSLSSWTRDYYKSSDLITIMTRVPTHEPYDQHESIDPILFDPINLDPSIEGGPLSQLPGGLVKSIKNTFKLPPNLAGVNPAPTGNQEQDNLQAFLWMIRFAEGTASPTGYQAQWPSTEFDIKNPLKPDGSPNPSFSYLDHPREVKTGNGISSSAAGAYQFLYRTWVWCKKALDLKDFSPISQDKAAIFLLAVNNSIENIKKGNFSDALYQNRKTWASLPGADYPGQQMKDYSKLVQIYKSAGGKVA